MTIQIDREAWDSTKVLAARFNVQQGTVMQWRLLKGFPESAVQKIEGRVYWHVATVKGWYDARPNVRLDAYRREHSERLSASLQMI